MPLSNIKLIPTRSEFQDLEGDLDAESIAAELTKGFLQASAEFAAQRPAVARGNWNKSKRPTAPRATTRTLEQRQAEYKAANPEVMAWVIQHDQGIEGHFASNLMTSFIRFGNLSVGQLNAVRKILAENATREAERLASIVRTEHSGSDIDLSSVPQGFYAVPNGATRLKIMIDRPTPPSKWSGFIFVSDGAEYGQQKKYGRQAPGKLYTGEIKEALRAIIADPKAASAAYGKLVGRCGVCGRKLEDEASVERGIGPVCMGKMGW
jgi:hypothetical protein